MDRQTCGRLDIWTLDIQGYKDIQTKVVVIVGKCFLIICFVCFTPFVVIRYIMSLYVLLLDVLSFYTFFRQTVCHFYLLSLYVLSFYMISRYVLSLYTFCRYTFCCNRFCRYTFCLFIPFVIIRCVLLMFCHYTVHSVVINFGIIRFVIESVQPRIGLE